MNGTVEKAIAHSVSPRICPPVSPVDVEKMVAGEERLTIWMECVIKSGDSNGQSLYS